MRGTSRPRVRAIVDSGDLTPLDNGAGPNLYVIAAAAYDYGLPAKGTLRRRTRWSAPARR